MSVTKNIETGDFYLSDDLRPQRPKRLGPMPKSTWPKPYILFYAVSSPTLTRWVDVNVPEDIDWQQSESNNLLNTLNANVL